VSVLCNTAGCANEEPKVSRSVARAPFGTLPDGKAVEGFTLRNAHGLELHAITYGGIITSLKTPDRNGQMADIVLGFDSLAGYVRGTPYFGAIIGRYGNRIARGQFTLEEHTYKLATNNGQNHLHGGNRGFDKVVWQGEPFESDSTVGVVFTYTSADGEEGYPGKLDAKVTYTLTDNDDLVVDYYAVTDKPTQVNLTQHSYFNLTGGSGDILGHLLTLNASSSRPWIRHSSQRVKSRRWRVRRSIFASR
jgi:aldose 1-epimerase